MKKIKKHLLLDSVARSLIVTGSLMMIFSILSFLGVIVLDNYELTHSKKSVKNFAVENWDQGDTLDYVLVNVVKFPWDGFYYDELSVIRRDSISYSMILWADRNSILWGVLKDFYYDADIPYKKHKGKNTELDQEIVDLLNERFKNVRK